jgi:hypothetical protein
MSVLLVTAISFHDGLHDCHSHVQDPLLSVMDGLQDVLQPKNFKDPASMKSCFFAG